MEGDEEKGLREGMEKGDCRERNARRGLSVKGVRGGDCGEKECEEGTVKKEMREGTVARGLWRES